MLREERGYQAQYNLGDPFTQLKLSPVAYDHRSRYAMTQA